MDLHVYNTLILSDLHLGAETSRAREATELLKENRFHRLILLGDIFADLNFAPAHERALEVSRLHPQAVEPQAQH